MNCKQCNEPLIEKREDALFCNHNCQQKYFKRKKRILDRITKLEREIKANDQHIEELKEKLLYERIRLNVSLQEANEKLEEAESTFFELKRWIEMNWEDFQYELFQLILSDPVTYSNEYGIVRFGLPYHQHQLATEYRNAVRKQIADAKKLCLSLVANQKKITLQIELFSDQEIEQRIEKLRTESSAFNEELTELRDTDVNRLPYIPAKKSSNKQKGQRVSASRAYSGREILKMQFDGLILPGELGRFLGKIQRERCAIALTGDSGAGKSTFSFTLTKGFLQIGQSVAYFSLEAGFTESMQELVKRYQLDRYSFRAFGQGTLEDVRTEASNFDCVIIDSYSKISSRPEDFEALRQDFPKTVFVIIFQKTTDGKIRGGSSILFNSTATIDIRVLSNGQRVAVMQKSRYETENFVFSISKNHLLKADKNPVNWKELNN